MNYGSFSTVAGKLRGVCTGMLLLLIAGVPRLTLAHDVPPSIVMLDIGRTAIDVELQLPLSELGAALALPLASAPHSVVAQYGTRIERYIEDRLQVHSSDGRAYALRIESLGMRATDNVNWTSNDWLIVDATLRAPE
jgi:hypothetical protein